MRTRFLLSFAVVGFALIIPPHAQDSTPTAICDQAAASPVDQDRPAGVLGVAADQIDPKIAIPACEAAAAAAPNDPRIAFQLARAYEAAEAYEPARVQYAKAADQGDAHAQNKRGSPQDYQRQGNLREWLLTRRGRASGFASLQGSRPLAYNS